MRTIIIVIFILLVSCENNKNSQLKTQNAPKQEIKSVNQEKNIFDSMMTKIEENIEYKKKIHRKELKDSLTLISNKKITKQERQAIIHVSNFYNWYIFQIYQTDKNVYQYPKLLENNQYDIKEFKYELNNIGFFSKSFIDNEIDKLKVCNRSLKVEFGDKEIDGMFDTLFGCRHLFYDTWVGGQGEDIYGFKILDVYSFQDYTFVFVGILSSNDTIYMTYEIEIQRNNKNCLINLIRRL